MPNRVVRELALWDKWKKRTIHALLASRVPAPRRWGGRRRRIIHALLFLRVPVPEREHEAQAPQEARETYAVPLDMEPLRDAIATIKMKKPKEFSAEHLATRIHHCGSSLLILGANTDKTEPTLTIPARCDSAACPHCARLISHDRAVLVARQLRKCSPGNLRMMTLTVKNCERGKLRETILKLHKAFRYFRDSRNNPDWGKRVDGYIWNLEVTMNPKTQEWHPHIHILYDGRYWPIDSAKATWRRLNETVGLPVSEGYDGVWIERLYFKDKDGKKRPVNSPDEFRMAAAEISKYNVKPLEAGVVRNEDVVEVLQSLFNTRRFGAVGTLDINAEKKRKAAVEKNLNVGPKWSMLGSFLRLESEGEFNDDPAIYVRTLEQLSSDLPALASVLRKHARLAAASQDAADAEIETDVGKEFSFASQQHEGKTNKKEN
jgi:hypothetical protein